MKPPPAPGQKAAIPLAAAFHGLPYSIPSRFEPWPQAPGSAPGRAGHSPLLDLARERAILSNLKMVVNSRFRLIHRSAVIIACVREPR